jgi:predicted DNA-binding transcriptional regulator AlpA
MTQVTPKAPETQKGEEALPPLLDKEAVCQRLGIAPRTLENMVKEGEFPPAVKLGKRVYWSELSVRSWQRMLFAAQEAWRP